MHVDGFRFDLATALAREAGGFDPGCAFLDALRQDPVLAGVKLIAEPWDVATCETGRFPQGITEWNDRFRDAARGFWLTGATGCG
jgi:glycogen operon protein